MRLTKKGFFIFIFTRKFVVLQVIAMNKKHQEKTLFKAIELLLVVFMVFCFPKAYSQDTINSNKTLELPEFSISEKLDKMYAKINTQQIDSTVIENNATNNLATLLSENSAVTIRSYGVSGLSSVSMRGGNSNHTAVLWNGFNLQDPLNGGYNFSSSTVNLIDEINVQYGGGSSAYGSGAIGGTIHLNNKPMFNKKLNGSILYTNGSFGFNSINTKIGFGSKKLSTRLRLFRHTTKNDFKYINVAKIGKPTEVYTNAEMEQYGLLHEMYFKLKKNQLFSSQFWYQNNFREIPPNSTASSENIEDYQKDSWYRWALNWNKKGEKIHYEARTGFFYSQSNYYNSSLNLNAQHNSFKNVSEVLATAHLFKNQKITMGINNNYTLGISENFIDNPTLNTTSFYLAPSFTILKKITLNTSVREEFYSNVLKPVTYSLNGKYNFYQSFYLTASFSKNYRTPTFNDLFWSGGYAKGNLNLEDEYGYSKDVGFEMKLIKKKTTIKSNVSFYHNLINNQIQWISEGQTWSPKNVKLVETKGVEFVITSNYKLQKELQLIFNLSYTYTDAQIKEKASSESYDVLNKQLIYIPFYQANSLLGIKYKRISFNTHLQYVGYQFTRADNLEWIEAFVLTNIGAHYNFKIKNQTVKLLAKINNVFDKVYEIRQWYPMPGINYEIGIKIIIN
jgi:iron complex outermembrane receptor protein